PVLKPGQVLVKMAYAPINPADLAFLTGHYGLKKPYPVVPGLEGSGVVVSSGKGWFGKYLINKAVACASPNWGDGSWGEYMVTDSKSCIPLPKSIPLDQGAMFFVNPLTAVAFYRKVKTENVDLVLVTAAESALNKMVLYHMKNAGVPTFGIVRKEESVEKLEKAGFDKVFNSESPDFEENIKVASKTYKKVIIFDAISGGTVPYKMLRVLPSKTKLVVYGRLNVTTPAFEPHELLFKENIIEGFWLSKYLYKKPFLSLMSDIQLVKKMLKSGFTTTIQDMIRLKDLKDNLNTLSSRMSKGKILLKF
ncbi:MAG: alcohol dehydrogenase catalytic domain-containing protein, partial [Leadbetterella sp.]